MTDPAFKDIFNKVLFIGPDLSAKGKGGIASVLRLYGERLPSFHYLQTNSYHGMIAGLLYAGMTFLRIPFARLKGRKIAHIHYAAGKSWVRKTKITAWARLWGYKIVMHSHSGLFKAYSEKVGMDKISRVLTKVDANVALSKAWADFFTNEAHCKNVKIINNMVSRPDASLLAEKSRTNNKTAQFLFLGLISDNKGIFEILEAVARLKKEGYKLRLTVGGNGETERLISEIARLGIEDFVDFRGWVSGSTKQELLAGSDVLLLPSHNEGLPISILEAMSYGTGVIASPVGGIPEIITDSVNGRLVPPGNVDALFEAMKEAIEHPDLARAQGEKSARIVEAYYPEAVTEELYRLYKGLL